MTDSLITMSAKDMLNTVRKTVKTVVPAFVTIGMLAAGPVNAAQEQNRVVPESRQQLMLSYAPLVQQTAPAVVNIYTKSVKRQRRSAMFDDPLFRRFFGGDRSFGMPQERVQQSLGSGVIVRSNGVIVTNHHVIKESDEITVVLHDRREFAAKVILEDPKSDLAILKIDTGSESLQSLELDDSDDVLVGDVVLAIGNPFGVGQTVTSGIVSATSRTRQGINDLGFFIQTDAAVNPGNSGGALVGVDGKLMGINTAILSRTGASNGIGFAVPSNMVKSVIRAALNEGQIERPWLGVNGKTLTNNLAAALGLDRPGGVLIDNIYPGSPAAMADVKVGDVILAIDQKEVVDKGALDFRVATKNNGDTAKLVLWREGRISYADVTLTMPPEDPPRNMTELDGAHAFQGVTILNMSPKMNEELQIDPFNKGVLVIGVKRNTPAGYYQYLRRGDVIVGLNGQSIDFVKDLTKALDDVSNQYVYDVIRRGQRLRCQLSVVSGKLARSGCNYLRR